MSTHKTLVIPDPRLLDGDPYEVAGIATRQSKGLASELAENLRIAALMARNAELSRQLDSGSAASEQEWLDGPQARAYDKLIAAAEQMELRLEKLALAAEFNPRQRIR